MTEQRRVVVTGLGIVSPLGTGVEKNWEALVAGRSGIRKIDRFPKVTVWKVRLTIAKSTAPPAIRKFCLYHAASEGNTTLK